MGSKLTNKNVRWAFNVARWQPFFSDISLATSCIQPEEKVRLDRFVFKDDFKSSLIGRLMMRKYVSDVTATRYDQLQLYRDEKGKPYSTYDVNFNVSHQGDWTVLAGSDDRVGVDVVRLERPFTKSLDEYFRIMNRTFSEHEWRTIKEPENDRDKLAMFCRHWCLKESYVKAVGVGITINLQDVSFKVNTKVLSTGVAVNDSQVFVEGVELSQWRFFEHLLDKDHCVAVATTGDDGRIFTEIDFTDLMKGAVPLLEADDDYCQRFFQKGVK